MGARANCVGQLKLPKSRSSSTEIRSAPLRSHQVTPGYPNTITPPTAAMFLHFPLLLNAKILMSTESCPIVHYRCLVDTDQ
ncbi:hypothetical protein FIBSPDRAFT_866022 [Athelia psychrophila]|uniref:Uncharacterized protein n=1 Tax=Athelia psychrophila TaxID=1759441 RepID=A0A166F1V1_9AGAM|nr:hypothetical protein FIBSPDRAFT_866022 [Fibularhizoctonia sp. CBS 109695]